ncbi:hypothetical protein DL95DRAFT_498532 [Leptodontidium sp. 2 PMI_412]|nr:hypothetical protein DL95DRAFT_498532 [Leptodontidium sp. 2 PMI_412]
MAPQTTPNGIYSVDFDATKVVTFPNIQTWTNDLFNAVGNGGGNALEEDFNWMQDLFQGVDVSRHLPINLIVGELGGGATWSPENLHLNVTVSVSISKSPLFLRYLVVSEMTEVFMLDQGRGWFGGSTTPGSRNGNGNEGDNGEALSRFLGRQFLVNNGSSVEATAPRFTVGNNWLQTSSRDNFITNPGAPSNSDIKPDADVGCNTLFISYLNTQLGFKPKEIVQHAAPNMQGVYKNLTGDDGDPFPVFALLLNSAFPPGPPGGVGAQVDATKQAVDSPFPIALLEFISSPKSWFGKDEVVNAVADPARKGLYPDVILLQLQGVSRNLMNAALPILSGPALGFASGSGFNISFDSNKGIQFQQPNNVFIPQIILFPLNVTFTAASIASFPSGDVIPGTFGPFPIVLELNAAVTELGLNLTALTEITFSFGENPYFHNVIDITPLNSPPTQTNLNPWYLSQDLRVFTATPELDQRPVKGSSIHALSPSFPATAANNSGAYQYIQDLLRYMNTEYSDPNGQDPFATSVNSALPSQFYVYSQDSSVSPYTYGTGLARYANFNFAIARVRLQGTPGTPANDVRVFFRLWNTNSADTQFDESTYPSHKDASQQPIFPLPAADLHTIPFFATKNNPDPNDPNNAEYGPNGVGVNTHNMDGSVWKYFGCYLNLYDPTVKFQKIGSHHCLVAQIAFSGTPVTITGTFHPSPENSDKLAQRNLSTTFAENPGPATKIIPQTFDLRPTAPVTGTALDPQQERPDDLLIEWGDTPPDSTCQIYWPSISAPEVIRLAQKYYGNHFLTAKDAHTIELKSVRGISYVPIPPSNGENYAGLITVDLPMTITAGQHFNIVLRRLSTYTRPRLVPPTILRRQGVEPVHTAPAPETPSLSPQQPQQQGTLQNPTTDPNPGPNLPGPPPHEPTADYWKYEVGSFAVSIPVAKAEDFVHYELDALAIFKYRLQQTPTTDRWHPVLKRYVDVLIGRVDGLVGRPGAAQGVPAGPNGAPIGVHWPGCEGGEHGGWNIWAWCVRRWRLWRIWWTWRPWRHEGGSGYQGHEGRGGPSGSEEHREAVCYLTITRCFSYIDYYGVAFDHLVPAEDPDPEVLAISMIVVDNDGGAFANRALSFPLDPTEYTGKKVLAVPRCCQVKKDTQDRRRWNGLVAERDGHTSYKAQRSNI